ncbi:MAG: DUF5777 family beta-barrel protein [Bacteroidota bacterium]|nr:DUF5777 family beta-barrel protein [Bacteroidota bacterium]
MFPIFMYRLYLSLLFCLFTLPILAQEDSSLLNELMLDAKPGSKRVDYTFKDTRLINFHTTEVLGARELDFRISHRFGNLNSGADGFYGLDGGASILIGLEYSYNGRLMVGLNRSNINKMVSSFLKYKLLYQTEDNRMPVSVSLLAQSGITSIRDPQKTEFFNTSDRLNYVYQVMISRKFNDWLSIQLSPTYIHYNIVQRIDQSNAVLATAFVSRFRYNVRSAVTLEYGARINRFLPETNTKFDKYTNSLSIGWEKETGGHVFSMHLSNSLGINEATNFAYTTDKWSNGGIRIGFNIRRVFSL